MANLLALPNIWNLVNNFGSTPVEDTNVWTGEGFDFAADGYTSGFAMVADAQVGEIVGSFVTGNGAGTPDDPVALVIARFSASIDPNDPPDMDSADLLEVYYAAVDTEHDVSIVVEDTEGYIVIGMYHYNVDTPEGVASLYADFVSAAPPFVPVPTRNFVYEMETGFSFDGNYIPHFLELNWYFGDNPFDYTSIQKVRIHGLAKGVVNLQVRMAGMQGDLATDYISDYMVPQSIDLPFTPIKVQSDFASVTNYVDYSDRGLALQMFFDGRNTDISRPEPAHVIQVLALQESPQGNGKRSN